MDCSCKLFTMKNALILFSVVVLFSAVQSALFTNEDIELRTKELEDQHPLSESVKRVKRYWYGDSDSHSASHEMWHHRYPYPRPYHQRHQPHHPYYPTPVIPQQIPPPMPMNSTQTSPQYYYPPPPFNPYYIPYPPPYAVNPNPNPNVGPNPTPPNNNPYYPPPPPYGYQPSPYPLEYNPGGYPVPPTMGVPTPTNGLDINGGHELIGVRTQPPSNTNKNYYNPQPQPEVKGNAIN